MPPTELPRIAAWNSRFGLVEEYRYPRGPADTGQVHVHRDIQICFSLDFPGRYLYRGRQHEVPVGAVSILDSWEPHASSDPCDRGQPANYIVMYVDPAAFRSAVDVTPNAPLGTPVRTDTTIVHCFSALYRALAAEDSVLRQDECYQDLASVALLSGAARDVRQPAGRALERARDYIAAHATQPIALRDVAVQADLSRWHLTRAFRRRFGVPPHRFQMLMRIDAARRLLASRRENAEVAQEVGFADESHFIRWFKRVVRTTPARYRAERAISGMREFPS